MLILFSVMEKFHYASIVKNRSMTLIALQTWTGNFTVELVETISFLKEKRSKTKCLNVLNVEATKHGRMVYATFRIHQFKDSCVETAATDSAKQVRMSPKTLNVLKRFKEWH